MNMVRFSYIPLMITDYPEFGGVHECDEAFVEKVAEAFVNADPTARGCTWRSISDEDDTPMPILMFERAADLRDDMVAFSGGEPGEWFTCDIAEDEEGRYCIVLMPNIEKSMGRIKFRTLLETEEANLEEPDGKVLMKPLTFVSSPNAETWGIVKEHLRDETPIGFIEITDNSLFEDFDVLSEYIDEHMVTIGPLKIQHGTQSAKAILEGFKGE